MAYGGDDGRLETGEVCIVRPVRYKRRRYSTTDLLRIYAYVVEQEGFEFPTCALLNAMGVVDFARENLDALRDMPCVGSGYEQLLPESIKNVIERETGVNVDDIPLACEPNQIEIGAKAGAALAVIGALLWLLRKIKRNPILVFVLKRVFLFALIEAVFAKLVELVQFFVLMIIWARVVQQLLEVLACQRDEDGNLKPFTQVLNVSERIADAIKKRNEQ